MPIKNSEEISNKKDTNSLLFWKKKFENWKKSIFKNINKNIKLTKIKKPPVIATFLKCIFLLLSGWSKRLILFDIKSFWLNKKKLKIKIIKIKGYPLFFFVLYKAIRNPSGKL